MNWTTSSKILASLALGVAALAAGCGGGGGGGGNFIGSPNPTPTPFPTTTRTFNVNPAAGTTFAVVSSAVGSSDQDTSAFTVSVSDSAARVVSAAPSLSHPATPMAAPHRYAVLHRELARQAPTHPVTEHSQASYDTSPTMSFFISTTNSTVVLNNRTPGVLGNAPDPQISGGKPQTVVTYVEQVGGQDVIDTTHLQNAINAWEVTNPFGPSGNPGIYQTMHSIFGSEWTAGGGNDGDPRVVLLFLSTATMGDPGLFGFVDFADELSPQPGVEANSGEIIYLQATPDSVSQFFEGDGFDGYATLVHELQHLIIFNNKFAQQGTFPAGASIEDTTIDEGLSTLAEDDNGFSINPTPTGGGNSFIFGAIQSYETTPQNTDNFFVFNDAGQDFGKAYLFFKHIQDTLGVSTITAIDESHNTGSANIANQVGTTFANELQQWALANFVSGLSGTTQFTYSNLNMAGTFSLSNNNNPNTPVTETLPGIATTPATTGTTLDAFAAEFLGLTPPAGSSTITVTLPSNSEASLVQLQGNTVTSVTF